MEEGRRSQRTTRFSGGYSKFAEGASSDDEFGFVEEGAKKSAGKSGGRAAGNSAAANTSKLGGKMRIKQCPGCGAHVSISTRECPHCDNQFSSKTTAVPLQTAVDESENIQAKFPFEPEREEEGSLIIQLILGRRPRIGSKKSSKPTELALMSAMDAKYDYDYLIKFKNMSYMHAQWLSAAEIESMSSKSTAHLNRYLTKIDKGDSSVQVDGDIDASYLEVDRILDYREEEVVEVVDDLPPAAEAGQQGTTSRLAAAIAESNNEEDAQNNSMSSTNPVKKTSSGPVVKEEASNAAGYTALGNGEGEGEGAVVKSITATFQGMERCRKVLERIMDDGFAVSFLDPVDTEAFDDYLDVVGESVCLNDIVNRMNNGDYAKYNGHTKFLNDVRVIWRNCKLYNIHKSQIWHCAHYMSMLFERLFRAWVLSFANGAVPMSDPIARPWDPSCRVCLDDKDDAKVILCDHCDASYHIYCLRPPLKSIPEGTWICDHCSDWISRSNGKLLSAAAEEEARLNIENAGVRKYIRVKKKKYLVKWRGLSYRDCTWEVAEDLKDDAKIAEFHRFNDTPPEEPPLSQAEIAMELSKDKKMQIYPAMRFPALEVDTISTVVAQIRTLHFLKWNKLPPDAVLKESGPSTFAYVYGYRTAMALPSALPALITSAECVKEEEMEVVNSKEDDRGAEEQTTAEGATGMDEIKDNGNGVSEEANDGAHPSPGKVALKKGLSWLAPSVKDEIASEVSDVLAAIVYSVARGDLLPPRPELPPNHLEVRIAVPHSHPELCMSIGDFHGRSIIAGFKRRVNGTFGPVERTNRVKVGDVIAGINGIYVGDWKIADIANLLKRACRHSFITLRLVRVFGPQTASNVLKHLNAFISSSSSKRIPLSRSRFFGVFKHGEKWSAESYYDHKRNFIAEFDSEEEAARAYDAFVNSVVKKNCSGLVKNYPLVNFTADGYLTRDAVSLGKQIDAERRMALENTLSLGMVNDIDTDSIDSRDDDSLRRESQGGGASKGKNSRSPVGLAAVRALEGDEEEEDSSDDDEDDESEEGGSSDWDSDHGEWRPKEASAEAGPLGRLLKAVNEADSAPLRSEWANYILELGMSKQMADGQVVLIEQMEPVTGETVKLWDSVAAASRALGIPMHEIIGGIKSKESVLAGGFRWRMLKTTSEEDASTPSANSEEAWKAKLYKTSRTYRSGGTLRDYQVEGLNWLLRCWYNKRSSILADEMGLGKTVQVITFLEHLYREEGIKGPFLVCVPLSTIEHWRRESESWTLMSVCIYHDIGGGRDMRDVIREFEWYYKGRSRRLLKFQILITTYDDLIKDYDELAEVPWRVVVVDEAHRLRNSNSKLLECMRSTCAKGMALYGYQHRVLMTGTPLQNNTAELWSLLNFIEPAKFPDAEKFAERFGSIVTQEQIEALQRRISPHILRRVKEDVAKDIPPKEETIIDVELTTMQKQYYRAIFEHNHGFLSQGFKGGNMPKLMNIQMELRKICNHPFLINGVEEKEMENLDATLESETKHEKRKGGAFDLHSFRKKRIEDFLIQTSGKMVLIDKLLPKLKAEGHKVLIFSQMVKMIDLIEEFCEFRRYKCERLDGRVSGNDRQKGIDRFNNDADSFVFLLSTRAGGVGINLTAADTVIIFDSDWNPQNDVQAMARCHRIGQLKSVTIYRLITRRSFEAEMFDRASRKLGLEQAVLGHRMFDAEEMEENQRNNAKLDAKELEQLLREGAYAVLLEDNNEEMKTFCEQDIESILDQRTHVIREEKADAGDVAAKNKSAHRARRSIFAGDSAVEFAEVDVNDPDFWKKVLPDLVTPDTMLVRLSDPDFDGDEEEDDPTFAGKTSVVKKYINDLSKMMEGILDLQRRGQLPERERGVCMKLLLQITLKEDIFDFHQRTAAQEWLSVLEGTRNRRRAEIDKYQPPPVPVREDRNRKGASRSSIKAQKLAASKTAVSDAANTVKKRKRGGVKFREDSDLERDDPSDDDVLPEEDFDDELGRGGAGAKIGKVRGKGKAQKVEKSSDGSSGKVRRRRSDAGRPRSLSRKDASEAADTLNEGQEDGKRKSSSRRRPKSLPPVGDDREEKDDESISDDEFLAKKQRQRKSVSRRAPAKKLSAEDTRVNEEAMLLKRQLLEGRHASNAFSDSEEDDNQDMKSSDEEAI